MPSIEANFGAARAAQQIDQLVMARLLASIAQAGQAHLQTPTARVDTVQISAQAQALAAARG